MNKYKKLVSNTLIFAIGSFGSKILLLLLTRLYTGNINPGDNSTKELLEQTANFLIPIITFSIADAVIRYGIDKNFDNRKIFTSACVTEAFGIGVLLLLSPLLNFLPYTGLCGAAGDLLYHLRFPADRLTVRASQRAGAALCHGRHSRHADPVYL